MLIPTKLKPIFSVGLLAVTLSLAACDGTKTQFNHSTSTNPGQPTASPTIPPLSTQPSPAPDRVASTDRAPTRPAPRNDLPDEAPTDPVDVFPDAGAGSDDSSLADSESADSSLSDAPTAAEGSLDSIAKGTTNADLGQVDYVASETAPDPGIERAIERAMPGLKSSSEQVRYYYNRLDLNSDGDAEVLAYLDGAYTCGTGGCTMLVLEPQGQEYELVSRITLINPPVIVSEERTGGWNDLIVHVAGGGPEDFYAHMQFDGDRYPSNPSVAPAIEDKAAVSGTAIITDADQKGSGITLQP